MNRVRAILVKGGDGMHENEKRQLDTKARDWAHRILAAADSLQTLAIERKLDDDMWAALTMGAEARAEANPRIDCMLPHADAVMDCSLMLRKVAGDYPIAA